jgi:3-phosphoshikimate 1-carboxyvinyltransferase
MRFLTAYFAATAIKKTITGSERMRNRPIGELVDALNSLGAEITYAEKQGYPPLVTSGNPLKGSEIHLRGSISSQYITALLLVAPILPQGLTIYITDTLISSSYVKLTLDMMRFFGVKSKWEGDIISIAHQEYKERDYTVEADWSGASYWYQMAFLSDSANLFLKGLFQNSSQGDASIADLFQKLGIETEYVDGGVKLSKKEVNLSFFEFDFINNPDMVQTFVVALCLKGIPFRLSGAQSLRIKETDRIAALQVEMNKLGYTIQEPEKGVLTWDGMQNHPMEDIRIDTYDDHRMALAFAPAAIKFPGLIINHAEVVSKSYPNYWDELEKVGAVLEKEE